MDAGEVGRLVEGIAARRRGRDEGGRLALVGAEHGRRVRLHTDALHKSRILLVAFRPLEVRFAHDVAAFHRPVLLGVRKFHARAGVAERRPGREAQGVARPDGVGVEARARANVAGLAAAVAEREHDGVIREAGLDVDRTAHGAAVDGHLEHMGVLLALRELRLFLARHL